MRIFLGSPILFDEAPKALQIGLLSEGITVTIEDAIETTARMLGFDHAADWAMMSSTGQASPLDHEVSQSEQDKRRVFQARHLAGYLDVSPDIARSIIDIVEPSGSRRGEKRSPPAELPPAIVEAMKLHADKVMVARMAELTVDFALDALVKLRPRVTSRLTVDACMSKDDPRISSVVAAVRQKAPDMDVFGPSGWGMLAHLVEKMIGDLLASPIDPYQPGVEREVRMISSLARLAKLPEKQLARAITLHRIPKKLAEIFIAEAKERYGASKIQDVMYQPRNDLGFYGWFPGIHLTHHPQAEFWRPRLSDDMRASDVKAYEVDSKGFKFTVEVMRERVWTEEDVFRSYFVAASVEQNGRPLAVLRGQLLTCSTPDFITDEDLLEFAEEHSDQMLATAEELTNEIDADEIFEDGDIFILSHLERAYGQQQSGFGDAFLKEVVKILKKKHKRLGNIAYVVKPLQFRYPFDDRLPVRVRKEFEEASSALRFRYSDVAARCGLRGSSFALPPDMMSDDVVDFDEIREALNHGLRNPLG